MRSPVVTNYGAFVAFALVISIAVSIWDRHVPAETNVEDTLWLFLVACIAVVVTSGVELAFRRMRPGDDIVVPVADRLAAIHSVLICYSEGRSVDQATEEKVIRLGMLGTSTLRRVLRRSDYSPQYRTQMSGVVALVGRLVDITTALTQLSFEPSQLLIGSICGSLAVAVASIRSDLMGRRIPGAIQVNAEEGAHRVPLLREMENTIALIPQAFAGSPINRRVSGAFRRDAKIKAYRRRRVRQSRALQVRAERVPCRHRVLRHLQRHRLAGYERTGDAHVFPDRGLHDRHIATETDPAFRGLRRGWHCDRHERPGVHSAVPRFDCGIHGVSSYSSRRWPRGS